MQLEKNLNGEVVLTGYMGEIWQEMANKLELNYTVVEGYQYGLLNANGTWSGLIGMLHYNAADIAVGDFTPTPSRRQVVDFCMAYLSHE